VKAKLEFDFDNCDNFEEQKFNVYIKALELYDVIYELDQHLRSRLKHGNLTGEVDKEVQEIRDKLHEELSERNCSTNMLP